MTPELPKLPILSGGKLTIVSNRLPISVRKNDDDSLEFYPSTGGLASALRSYTEDGSSRWIGWPGLPSDDLTEKDKRIITRKLRRQNCYPVFLTKKQLQGFYNAYSNEILWPAFHSMATEKKAQTESNYRTYKDVNQLYADAVLRLSKPNDDIWVHDYQLLLLPEMLRGLRPDAYIGFFLHIPWPGYKDFEQITHGAELLRGMLGASLVGFHTDSYVENFLECCKKASAGVVEDKRIVLPTRIVQAERFPIGIDYKKYALAAISVGTLSEYVKLKRKHHGRKVIVMIDRLDPTKNIPGRLRTYKALLDTYPEYHGKVTLIMQAMPSRTDIPAYQRLRREVDKLIDDINSIYATPAWQPLVPIFEALPFNKYDALYVLGDVAFITPVRDGMNLVAKEYAASRTRGDGVLVLSRTAGVAEEMRDAVIVDSASDKSMLAGLRQALNMPLEEQKRRMTKMRAHLRRHTVDKWADRFLKTLVKPVPSTLLRLSRPLSAKPTRMLIGDYHQAQKRLFLLDYDGTLHPRTRRSDDSKPTSDLVRVLRKLGTDPKNEVVIMSGRQRRNMDEWFGELPVSLVAEQGAYLRKAGKKQWQAMVEPAGSWREEVAQILHHYMDETPGSTLEIKTSSVVWDYQDASAYTAAKNLVAIRKVLKSVAKEHNLRIRSYAHSIEIAHFDVTKVHAMQNWLLGDQDFVLIGGDNESDEAMFRAAPPGAYTIKVGRGITAAHWRLTSYEAAIKLLKKM